MRVNAYQHLIGSMLCHNNTSLTLGTELRNIYFLLHKACVVLSFSGFSYNFRILKEWRLCTFEVATPVPAASPPEEVSLPDPQKAFKLLQRGFKCYF